MLKIVVFDCGYGGEFFADELEEVFPTIQITRVIDWRRAAEYLVSSKKSRKLALEALRPYIGKVDLIVLANHLLSVTSLKYFQRCFKTQKFIGFKLKQPDTFLERNLILLTTRAVTRTVTFHYYIYKIKRHCTILAVDSWPAKIDDGVLTREEIEGTIRSKCSVNHVPEEVVLACSQFNDIKSDLRKAFGQNLKIYDSFDDTIRETAKALHIRGGVPKQK